MPEHATTGQRTRQPAHQAASPYSKADGAPVFPAGDTFGCRTAYPAVNGFGAVAKANAPPVAPAPHPAEPVAVGEAHVNPHSHRVHITNIPVAHQHAGGALAGRRRTERASALASARWLATAAMRPATQDAGPRKPPGRSQTGSRFAYRTADACRRARRAGRQPGREVTRALMIDVDLLS
jgi:hypothetical protein